MRGSLTASVVSVLASAVAGTLLLAPAAHAGDSGSGRTTIRMEVRDCEGCTIRPALLRIDADGKTQDYWGTAVRVRDGVAVMRVPTDTTAGMSFVIYAGTRAPDINALPVIVTQYLGQPAGSVVTRAQARAAKQASGCWLGTSASSVTLRVQATTVRLATFPPDGTTTPVVTAWLVPSIRVPKGQDPSSFGAVFNGVLATQNGGWPCNAG